MFQQKEYGSYFVPQKELDCLTYCVCNVSVCTVYSIVHSYTKPYSLYFASKQIQCVPVKDTFKLSVSLILLRYCAGNNSEFHIVVPPIIVETMTSNDMIVREGTNITLTCKARGYPEPYVIYLYIFGNITTLAQLVFSNKRHSIF